MPRAPHFRGRQIWCAKKTKLQKPSRINIGGTCLKLQACGLLYHLLLYDFSIKISKARKILGRYRAPFTLVTPLALYTFSLSNEATNMIHTHSPSIYLCPYQSDVLTNLSILTFLLLIRTYFCRNLGNVYCSYVGSILTCSPMRCNRFTLET